MFENKESFKKSFETRIIEKYGRSVQESHITERFDILGTMEGNIVSTGTVSLRAKSVFTGTIKAAYIAIESGAVFNGECHIQREVQQK